MAMQTHRAVLPGRGRDRRRRLGVPLSDPVRRTAGREAHGRRVARTGSVPDARGPQRAEVAARAGRGNAQGARERRRSQIGAAARSRSRRPGSPGRSGSSSSPARRSASLRSCCVFMIDAGLLAALGIGFAMGFGMPLWLLKFLKKRREAKFLQAFPDAVDVIVRGIKAGLPLLDSLRIIATDATEPVKSEFRAIVETQTIGIPLGEACAKLYGTAVGTALRRRAPAPGCCTAPSTCAPFPCSWSPTTTPSSTGWCRPPLPAHRPGPHRLAAGAPRGPGGTARAGGRLRRSPGPEPARRGRAPAARGADRRPGERGLRGAQPLPRWHGAARRQHDVRRRRGHRGRPGVRRATRVVRPGPGLRGAHRRAPPARHRGTIPGGTSPPASTCPPGGVSVPVTVVRHRDTPLDGTAPLLLYGYGAYESTEEPDWDPALPSLLDRGVVFAARARPWRRRGRPTLVARRPAGAQAEHVHRLRRGRRRDGGPVRRRLPDRLPRALRRRPAPGRGVQPASGAVAGGGGRGPVRRRRHDDVRRHDPAHGQRVGRVGRPAAPGRLRLDARLLALRQPAAGRARAPTSWSPAPSTTRG